MNSLFWGRTWLVVVLTLRAVHLSTTGLLDWGRSDSPQVNIPWLPFENESRCYDELGCLNVTREWYHLIYRPFNVFPLPREVINTRFVLYTRKNPSEGHVLRVQNEHTIRKSNFDAQKPTKFIIHGFIDTPLSNWVKDMRKELLKHADWNVIVVDWAGGSLPLYTQATANTRLVGLELAYFVNSLQRNFGLDPAAVHMIGHSLGAHTAGYAGERIAGLGRITGLDPAEPYFQGMPSFVRLDPSDAKFVDVIHTDGKSIFLLGYGMRQPCGHVDFYPNNGKEQPGCDLTEAPLPLTLIREGIEEASRVLVACNHIRAIKLFIDSINSKCPYIARRCDSYQNFLQGRCFSCHGANVSECAVMGLRADESVQVGENEVVPGGKFFITTGKDLPFCRHHYRVTVELAKPPKAENWVQGFMRISLQGDTGEIRNLDLTPSGYVRLQHGQSRSFVVAHPTDVEKIRKVEFYWEYDMDYLQPRSLCFLWCNDHLYVAKIHVEEMGMTSRGMNRLLRFEISDMLSVFLVCLLVYVTEFRAKWISRSPPLPIRRRNKAKNIKHIPGPRPALPILGTRWIYSSFGHYKITQVHDAYRDMFERYGRIIKEEALWNFPVVSLLERKDIEAVLKKPSRYPLRPPTEVISYYRQTRPDRYCTMGIVNEQGEKWHTLRSILTPELTSAKTIQRFMPELNLVTEDFISLLRNTRDNQGMVTGFQELTNRIGLESTCVLILGRRLGFLEREVDPLAAKLAEAVKGHFCASRDTFYGLPFWKVFPTRAYKELVRCEDDIYDIVSELVESALKEERDTCAVEPVSSVFMSILNAHDLDIREKKSAIIDFIAAGIQTLGNSLVFLMYLIAKNPEVQERLYEEIQQLAPGRCPLRAETLRNAKYLQACLMESFRVLPTATCIARILESEMELSGYQLPAGSVVLCHTWLACQEESNFTEAHKFKPERWLDGGEMTRFTPFLTVPFGVGRRICPGKRFAEQILQLTVAKMVREFHVDFEGELDLQFEFLLSPSGSTNFTFRDRHD